MTILEDIQRALNNRAQELIKIQAPQIIIDNQLKLVQNPKIGGDTSLLGVEVISKELKTGRGGKKYIVYNENIGFYPNARYGMYISML